MAKSSRFTVFTEFKAKDYLSKKLGRIATRMKVVQRRQASMRKQQDQLNKVLRVGATAIGATAAAAGAAAVAYWKMTDAGRELDTAMSGVAASMGKAVTDEDVQRLRNKAKDMGATTAFTAAQAAEGLDELAKAGFNTEQSLGSIETVLNGASAGSIEMAEAAGIMTSAMSAFDAKGRTVNQIMSEMGVNQKEASKIAATETSQNAQHIMDVMALAATKTKSSISTLGESMKSLAPVAKQFGFSFADSVAMAAKMQDVGIDASESGNAVKTMLTKLTSSSKEAQRVMKSAGVSFVDEYGNMKPPEELFKAAGKLKESLTGNAAVAKTFANLVGLRGQKALTVLADSFNKASYDGETLSQVLNKAQGAAKKMADTKLDNVDGDVKLLGSSWDGLKVSIHDATKGALRPFIQSVTKFLDEQKPRIEEFAEGVVSFFEEWGDLIKIVLVVFGVLIGVVMIALTLMSAWLGIQLALAAASLITFSPMVLAIMAVVAVIALAIIYWDEFKIGFMMGLDLMLLPVKALYNALAGVVNLFGGAMEYADMMSFTDDEMSRQDKAANQAARERKESSQSANKSGAGNLDGSLGIELAPGLIGTAGKKPKGSVLNMKLPQTGAI